MDVLWISHGFDFQHCMDCREFPENLKVPQNQPWMLLINQRKLIGPSKKVMKCYVAEKFFIGCANMFFVWFIAFMKLTSYNISSLFDLTLSFVCKKFIASFISIHYGNTYENWSSGSRMVHVCASLSMVDFRR